MVVSYCSEFLFFSRRFRFFAFHERSSTVINKTVQQTYNIHLVTSELNQKQRKKHSQTPAEEEETLKVSIDQPTAKTVDENNFGDFKSTISDLTSLL